MDLGDKVEEKLKELEIDYNIVNHPPALTTEDADRFIEGIEGVRTKTLFLTNKKKRAFYLIIMDEAKRMDMSKFGELVNEKTIKMASSELLDSKLGLPPGTVSPFGLLNNLEKDVKVYVDEEIVNEDIMCFHPNINTKTLFLKTKDLFKFFENIKADVEVILL